MPPPIQLAADRVDFSPRFRKTVAVVGSPAAAAETIIAQTAALGDLFSADSVQVSGWAAFTVGASGTAVTLRLRQTGLAGTVIALSGALTGGVAAGNLVAPAILGFDTAPVLPGQVYVLTLQVTAGSGVSTVSAVGLSALVI